MICRCEKQQFRRFDLNLNPMMSSFGSSLHVTSVIRYIQKLTLTTIFYVLFSEHEILSYFLRLKYSTPNTISNTHSEILNPRNCH